MIYEVLQRNSIKDSLEGSPYFLGITFGSALWVAYAWTTRLRHGVFLDAPTVFCPDFHSRPRSDAPTCPYLHAAFLFSFVLFMFALLCIVFCDPGISITQTKDELKSVRGISSLFAICFCAVPDFLYRLPKFSFEATA